MTKRASLAPKERAAMLDAQDGMCAKCGVGIDVTGQRSVAEHWVTVESGNDQKPDCLLCVPCAKRKTYGTKATTAGSDVANRAKVKRLQEKQRQHKSGLGDILEGQLERRRVLPKRKGRQLKGRGFRGHRLFDGTPVWRNEQ